MSEQLLIYKKSTLKVGKIERTVERYAAGIQHVNIIGFPGSPYCSHAPILTKNFIVACPCNRD